MQQIDVSPPTFDIANDKHVKAIGEYFDIFSLLPNLRHLTIRLEWRNTGHFDIYDKEFPGMPTIPIFSHPKTKTEDFRPFPSLRLLRWNCEEKGGKERFKTLFQSASGDSERLKSIAIKNHEITLPLSDEFFKIFLEKNASLQSLFLSGNLFPSPKYHTSHGTPPATHGIFQLLTVLMSTHGMGDRFRVRGGKGAIKK